VFNVSSGYGTSLNEIIGKIEAILGHPVERSYRPGRPFDVPASVLDNTLAQRELEWRPKVDLDAGIKMTAAWLRAQIHE
jgi:UDP-glucose 4-epimerase